MRFKLEEIRKSKNLTQAALAEKSGVNRNTINGLESGRFDNVHTDTLLKLANALGVGAEDLIT